MAEPNLVTSELNIFFDEWGHVGMGGGLHIKLIVPGTPTVETIQTLVDRVHEWGNDQEPHEEDADAPDAPKAAPTIRDPGAEASGKQKGMIKGMCEKKENDKDVIAILGRFGDPDGAYDSGGHYSPSWEYLNKLSKGDASKIIDALMKAD